MSNKESRLLSASKTFDQGLSRHHLSSWDSILDPHVTLHKDAITLYDDLHGLSTVKGYFQASSTSLAPDHLRTRRTHTSPGLQHRFAHISVAVRY